MGRPPSRGGLTVRSAEPTFTENPENRRYALRRLVLSILLASCVLPSWAGSTPEPRGYRIAPARTWVGLAPVYLEVSDLWLRGTVLEGRYRIRVPVMSSHNDEGTLNLELREPVEDLERASFKLSGTASSAENGDTGEVACEVDGEGGIRIHIRTGKRKLTFRSRLLALEPS